MSGSSFGYRASSGYRRRSDLYSSQSRGITGGDWGGYNTTTTSSHSDRGGSGDGYRPSNCRSSSSVVGHSSGSTSSMDSGSLLLSSSTPSYLKGISSGYVSSSPYSSGASSGFVSNLSYNSGVASTSVSNSSYSSGVPPGYVSNSSYDSSCTTGVPGHVPASRTGVGSNTYPNSLCDVDSSYQSAHNRRAVQSGPHLTVSTEAMRRDENDDGLLPSPGFPSIVTHLTASEAAMGRDIEDDGLLPTPRLPIAPIMPGDGRKRGRDAAAIIGAVAQLSQMGNPESKLALNILNSVLGGSEEEDVSSLGVSPPNKMMRMDMDEGHGIRRGQIHSPSLPVYNALHRDYQYQPPLVASLLNQILQSNLSSSHGSYNSAQQQRIAKKNIPRPDTKNVRGRGNSQQKGRKRSSGAAKNKTPSGQTASPLPTQRDSKDRQSSGCTTGKLTVNKEDIPLEALKCFICEKDDFSSVDDYLTHLKKQEHILTANAYHSHRDEVLDLLKHCAMLLSHRHMNKGKLPMLERSCWCKLCQCYMYGSKAAHYRSYEHMVVDHFIRMSCCGFNFFSKSELENHQLSLEHLQKMHKPRKDNEPSSKEEEDNKEPVIKGKGKEESASKDKDKESASKEEKDKEFASEDKESASMEKDKEIVIKEEDIQPAMKVKDKVSADEEENKEPMDKEDLEPALKVLEDKKSEMAEEVSEEEAKKMFLDAAKQHQANGGKEMFTSATLPSYDPTKPVGLHCLVQLSSYGCQTCPDTKLCKPTKIHASKIEFHFHTLSHYLNMCTHTVNKAREKKLRKEMQKGKGVPKEAADYMVDIQGGVQGSGDKVEINTATQGSGEKQDDDNVMIAAHNVVCHSDEKQEDSLEQKNDTAQDSGEEEVHKDGVRHSGEEEVHKDGGVQHSGEEQEENNPVQCIDDEQGDNHCIEGSVEEEQEGSDRQDDDDEEQLECGEGQESDVDMQEAFDHGKEERAGL